MLNVVGDNNIIRIRLLSEWSDPETIYKQFNIFSKGNCKWNNIQLVLDPPYDYTIILNATNIYLSSEELKKSIVFRMEPYMEQNPNYGFWSRPDDKLFKLVCWHHTHYNNIEWHLSKTYNELKTLNIKKEDKLPISTILSSKSFYEGHRKRVNFVKYIENKIDIDVYGSNLFEYKNYKGQLPERQKDLGLFPYKYTFNCENNDISNYYTEKLWDAILSECLIFYHGHPDILNFIDSRAIIYLELKDFEEDYNKIVDAIKNNEWEKRIEFIRKEKYRILDELQFFPRIEKLLSDKS